MSDLNKKYIDAMAKISRLEKLRDHIEKALKPLEPFAHEIRLQDEDVGSIKAGIEILLKRIAGLEQENAKLKEELGIMVNQREYNKRQQSNQFYFENETRGEG